MTVRKVPIGKAEECPHCGKSRTDMNDAGARIVEAWVRKQGDVPAEVISGYRRGPEGLSFTHGGGYAILDGDLLGGEGDGLRQGAFEEEMNCVFVWDEGRVPVRMACSYCVQYL